jgi:DNA-binding sugar fermentation-stimulating protein
MITLFIVVFNDIRGVIVISNMDSEYKQILVKKNVKQEIEVMVKENCYFVKHQQQIIKLSL